MKKMLLKKAKGYGITLLFPLAVYAVMAVVSLANGNYVFFNLSTLNDIFANAAFNTVVALAIALPMLIGRWDFSVGIIPILSGILVLNWAIPGKWHVLLVLLVCMLVSVALSLISTGIYLLLRVPTMISSIGVVLIMEAVTVLYNNGNGANVTLAGDAAYESSLLSLYTSPYVYIILVVICAACYFLLYKTTYGKNVYSLSNNPRLAVNAGVNQLKTVLITAVITGLILGVVALMQVSKEAGKLEKQQNLDSALIMFLSLAPLLIGMYLQNISNLPWGIFVGALGMSILSYAFTTMMISSFITNIVTGMVIIVFMAYSSNTQAINYFFRRLKRRKAKG